MISTDNLTFTYAGAQQPAVHGINLEVKRGQVVGFLGPSGAGKSTTQKILIKLLAGYRGSVTVRGRPLTDWGQDFFDRIGVCFEFPSHFQKLTARENLRYFSKLYSVRQEPTPLCERLGLTESLDKPVQEYSKGMQTRLGLIRALQHDPELIFLDEPTSGLDPVNNRRVRDLIRDQRAAGKTIFLTTHDMVVADDVCDRVALIVDGQIRAQGSPRDLKLQYGTPTIKVESRSNGTLLTGEFPLDDLGNNADFQQMLKSQVETIHSQEATLEDVFVALTGRELR